MIVAKVLCSEKQDFGSGAEHTASLRFDADFRDGANEEWAHSPNPNLALSVTVNGECADRFEQGKTYTLRIEDPDNTDAAGDAKRPSDEEKGAVSNIEPSQPVETGEDSNLENKTAAADGGADKVMDRQPQFGSRGDVGA